MQITQVNIRTANEHLVKGYVDIVFDHCFMIEEIRIIKGPRGLFISFLPGDRATALTGILPFRSMLKRDG
jgi:DNA-binding cell septation regulator SpoVG